MKARVEERIRLEEEWLEEFRKKGSKRFKNYVKADMENLVGGGIETEVIEVDDDKMRPEKEDRRKRWE